MCMRHCGGGTGGGGGCTMLWCGGRWRMSGAMRRWGPSTPRQDLPPVQISSLPLPHTHIKVHQQLDYRIINSCIVVTCMHRIIVLLLNSSAAVHVSRPPPPASRIAPHLGQLVLHALQLLLQLSLLGLDAGALWWGGASPVLCEFVSLTPYQLLHRGPTVWPLRVRCKQDLDQKRRSVPGTWCEETHK